MVTARIGYILKVLIIESCGFKKQNSQLLITIKGTEKRSLLMITIQGKRYLPIFSFQTNHHKIEGDNLALLIDNMSNVPDKTRELIQGVGHKMYGADLNQPLGSDCRLIKVG